ncbi:MAG TPA: glycosyltransferase family 4 protein [Tepidisphaeraceae bacterium]|nr:glycosyltransferase family 4 protein [Tepidisphaeraceae bacterium]
MKVLICWSHISGYMAACWRALAASGVDLSIVAFKTDAPNSGTQAAFKDDVVAGLNVRLLSPDEKDDAKLILDHAIKLGPDVIVVPGWFHEPYRALVNAAPLSNVKFVMTMDTPWQGTVRQFLAAVKLKSYLGRMSAVVVAGERAWQYAKHLGVPEGKILRGVYGFDAHPLENLLEQRKSTAWPRRFLFVGRYVDDKAINVLLAGYKEYRQISKEAWPLVCCGQGPHRNEILAAEGASDIGFVQPGELPRVLLEHGAFVIVSRYEPWGVAIAEAQYSGLPVICTEACGASVELVRHRASGLLVPTEDAASLARAMLWMEQNPDQLPAMGEIGKSLAKPFASEFWARRWKQKLEEILS